MSAAAVTWGKIASAALIYVYPTYRAELGTTNGAIAKALKDAHANVASSVSAAIAGPMGSIRAITSGLSDDTLKLLDKLSQTIQLTEKIFAAAAPVSEAFLNVLSRTDSSTDRAILEAVNAAYAAIATHVSTASQSMARFVVEPKASEGIYTRLEGIQILLDAAAQYIDGQVGAAADTIASLATIPPVPETPLDVLSKELSAKADELNSGLSAVIANAVVEDPRLKSKVDLAAEKVAKAEQDLARVKGKFPQEFLARAALEQARGAFYGAQAALINDTAMRSAFKERTEHIADEAKAAMVETMKKYTSAVDSARDLE